MYTFEERFNEGIAGTDAKSNGETAADTMKVVKEEVLLKYDEDQKIVLDQYMVESMLCMLVPHTHSLTDEVCKPMIKPVEQSIPDPLRQAISLSDKYDTYVETSIRDTIKKVCGIGGAPVEKTDEPKADEPKADEQTKESEDKTSEEPQAEEKAEEKPSEAGEQTNEPEAEANEKKCEETTEL
ncbi:hypothetical protein ACROYT_G002418 [Oculina patagonica]